MGVLNAVGLCFLLLFLFFYGGGFDVLLRGFWCETLVGGMWVGRGWLSAVGVGCGLWWGWLIFLFCIFIYCWFF